MKSYTNPAAQHRAISGTTSKKAIASIPDNRASAVAQRKIQAVVDAKIKQPVIQAKLKVRKAKNKFVVSGRPDFNTESKLVVARQAEKDGEDFLINLVNEKGSIPLPTIHRRHKVAWELWMRAINTALSAGKQEYTINELKYIASLAKVDEPKSIDTSGIRKFCNDIFNSSWNLWLGPGDENMKKGGKLNSALNNYLKAGPGTSIEEDCLEEVEYAVLDPRSVKDIEIDQNLKIIFNSIKRIDLSPNSKYAVKAVKSLLDYVKDPVSHGLEPINNTPYSTPIASEKYKK